MDKGKLYLVATPIGNLEDITFRALNVLKEVDIIAAEDMRQTLKLLNHYEITKTMISYHRHNEDKQSEIILERLREGKSVAIVTDAGTPGISDPGEVITKKAIEEDIEIIPIPGACALINALIISGIDTGEFAFYGFLSTNNKLRKAKYQEIKESGITAIMYEAPHRIKDTLKEMLSVFGNRKIAVVKELTKLHEKVLRGSIEEVIEALGEAKGEYVIVLEGIKEEKENELNNLSLEEHYKHYEEKGLDKKDIIKQIAKDRGVTKNEIYQKFI